MRRLEGKVIVVAGAATGIGAATALRLASEGAAVVVGDIAADGADAIAREIVANGGKAGSGAAFAGEKTRVAYAVAKAGVAALARHVASRWGQQGIRANVVSPGMVMSAALKRTISPEEMDRFLKDTCSTRLGEPADIAAMVAMLMSEDGAWINGQTLVVDGGDIFH
jgi:NAD(P)-dependent dehydrogenase (short-subunit alcohol dehydrogenase family)